MLKFDKKKLNEKANKSAVLGFSFLSALLGWLVLMALWNWFLAPLGLPRVGYWQSAGLSLFVSFIKIDYNRAAELDEVMTWYKFHRQAYEGFARPLIFLLMGWLIHFLVHRP